MKRRSQLYGKPSSSNNAQINPNSFYKLMFSPITQSKKLMIPAEFARRFGKKLSTACYLTVPTGVVKRVSVVKEGNALFFQGGWQEFVENFSIGKGYFLLFKYEGSSNFKVHIFDLTACEISYQCNVCSSSRAKYVSSFRNLSPGTSCKELYSDDSDSDSLQSLDSPEASPSNSDVEIIQVDSDNEKLKLPARREHSDKTKCGRGDSTWRLIQIANAAGLTIPQNPFFVVVIKPYALEKGRFLIVPVTFSRNHLIYKAGDIITIETSEGRQWRIRCTGGYSLGSGWTNFAQEVGLELGDVCIFELIDAQNLVLKVQIGKKSRSETDPSAPSSGEEVKNDDSTIVSLDSPASSPTNSDVEIIQVDTDDEDIKAHTRRELRFKSNYGRESIPLGRLIRIGEYERALEAITDVAGIKTPKNPFFVALIKPCTLHKGLFLNLPTAFCQKHLICKAGDTITIKTYDRRQWAVRYTGGYTKGYLGSGWINFAREVGLKVGDLCVFELSDAQKRLLNVQIVKSPRSRLM